MTDYTFDEKSLFRDGKRWFPVMGEIHYSRYPHQYWKEALLKMKAGGVDIVSAYTIWIHHEEIENEWDFTGDRNLRAFVETVKECGLTMFLRVGPWVHAEVRNGGFPDWLMAKCKGITRTNDKAYFAEVEKYYKKIYEQVEGLFAKDGGPIIGIQVENEYGHCGGLTGKEGEDHMLALTQMLKQIGFDAPLYTATGWGGAVTAGLLPVMGGYCDAPWDPRPEEIEPSGNFVFTYERNDHAIGSDFGLGEGVTFDMKKFPYLTAELGGGLQVTYKRRPIAKAKDIAAMSIAKMGSGCNLLGYYMYHGGTNPDGKVTSLQETKATGSFCELPEKTYDFRAPLGEYGQANGTYKEIRRLALFVHDWGEKLCAMDTYIPKENPLTPENFKDLRYSVRYDKENEKGYLFVNNYQRRNEMLDHYDADIFIKEPVEAKFHGDIKNGECFILPIRYGTIDENVPLCKLNGYEVFYARTAGKNTAFGTTILLSSTDSLNANKITSPSGKEYLIISEGLVYTENLADKTKVYLESRNIPSFKIIDTKDRIATPAGFLRNEIEEHVNSYIYSASTPFAPAVKKTFVSQDQKKAVYKINVEKWPADHFGTLCDVFLKISYTGNCARLYKDGKLVADNIYCGPGNTWEIGLKRFGKEEQEFTLEIDSLEASQKGQIYLENWPYIPNNDGAEFEAGFVSDAIKIDNQFSPKNAVCSLDGITSEHSLLVEFDLV